MVFKRTSNKKGVTIWILSNHYKCNSDKWHVKRLKFSCAQDVELCFELIYFVRISRLYIHIYLLYSVKALLALPFNSIFVCLPLLISTCFIGHSYLEEREADQLT